MASYPPHAVCWLWNQWLIGLHFWSDLLLALAYCAISAVIELFVLPCALTHLASAVTVYIPTYWISGGIKAIAALISVWALWVIYSVRSQAVAIISGMVKAYDGEG